MMRALALEHLGPDPVGIFGDVLEERGIEVDAVRLEQGEPLPDWRDYDLLVVMGGAMSVWEEDEHPWLVDEKRAIREAVLAGTPYFGVCLGAQLLASAFDTRVYLGPEPELGANQIFLTAEARRDPVFRGFPPDVEVFEFHLCHFDLPPGAVRLASSPRYQNQAIRYGRVAYAIQCHLEPSLEEIREWFDISPQLVARFESRHGSGSVEAFFEEYASFVPLLQRTGRQLFGRWLENALALGGLSAAARAVASAPGGGLVGRDRERLRIDAVLDVARAGGSGVLVLRGEAGTGKTALSTMPSRGRQVCASSALLARTRRSKCRSRALLRSAGRSPRCSRRCRPRGPSRSRRRSGSATHAKHEIVLQPPPVRSSCSLPSPRRSRCSSSSTTRTGSTTLRQRRSRSWPNGWERTGLRCSPRRRQTPSYRTRTSSRSPDSSRHTPACCSRQTPSRR